MRIASISSTLALGAIASGSAFKSPTVGNKQLLRLRLGRDRIRPSLRDDHLAAASCHSRPSRPPRGDVSVGLFRDILNKFKGDDEDEGESKAKDDSPGVDSILASSKKGEDRDDSATSASSETAGQGASPFSATVEEAAAVVESASVKSNEEEQAAPVAEATPIESKEDEWAAPVEQPAEVKDEKEIASKSPRWQAEELRAQAARIRLEADKRQVELTLEKIAKLNSKLEGLKKKDTVDTKDQQSLEEELQRLQSQLATDEKGEVKPVAVAVSAKSEIATSTFATSTSSTTPVGETSLPPRPSLSAEEMKERVKRFQNAPEFMKVLVAKTLGIGMDSDTPGAVDRLNATDIVQKMYDDEINYNSIASEFDNVAGQAKARTMIERAYEKSDDGDGKPVFTENQIRAKVKELDDVPDIIKGPLKGLLGSIEEELKVNDTELALMILEQEWKDEQKKKKGGGFFGLFSSGDDDGEKGEMGRDGERMDRQGTGSFSRLFSDSGGEGEKTSSDLSLMVESLYPKSTRKEDQTPDKKKVDAFVNEVVVPTKAFTPSSNPISVPGGWIIRGKNECHSGDKLIEKLDRRIASDSRLRENISFFLLKDPLPDPEAMSDPLNWPEVLFIAGPDVGRDPAFILRTAISSLAIATAWYGSITPFLANAKLLDRANDAMEMADAGMPTDLSWLSEMSIPLFVSFFALQFIHEAAHLAVAKIRGFELNIPTFVPSIASGITSSITSLKTSPKNNQELAEFAVAGPLAGMVASTLVLCYGLILTATADVAQVQMFPGLPLAILRSSSLGGGLIDLFLGNGVLNVPASAEGAETLASTFIALHPFALAGFVSLVVNALALVPAGRTDGGRLSLAIFGRPGSQGVTFISLTSLFILGLQSDLLLFYFAFIVFCQSELEIPMRNEVDDVGASKIFLAGFAAFLMLLTLIPMT